MKYLRERRGRWLVQVAVPLDLREKYGKTNVEKYLGTSEVAVAKRKKHAAVAEILAAFERARGQPELTSQEIEAEAKRYMLEDIGRNRRECSRAIRGEQSGRYWFSYPGDQGDARPEAWAIVDMLETVRGRGWDYFWVIVNVSDKEAGDKDYDLYHEIIKEARTVCRRLGVLEPSRSREQELCMALLAAKIEALKFVLHEANNTPFIPPAILNPKAYEPVVREEIPAARQSHAPRISEGPRLTDTVDKYFADLQRDRNARVTAQTEAQMRATFRLFGDYVGDQPLATVSRKDVADFLDALGELHPHYGRRPDAKKLTLQQLQKKYPAEDDARLGNRTLNRHLSALAGLWKWAQRRGEIDEDARNPFAGMGKRVKPKAKRPYTVEELNALFAGAVLVQKPKTVNETIPWIMAIALFSGMRQGEICELHRQDVKEEDGVWYFDVTAAKTEAGVRRVPIHSQLATLGFLDFIPKRGPLFPALTPGGPDRKRAHTLAKRFPEYRRTCGVTVSGVDFHSFRRNFIAALEAAGIDRDRVALIVGHERGFTFRVYNPAGVDMPALAKVVEAVNYPELKLPGKL
jgi:integrase